MRPIILLSGMLLNLQVFARGVEWNHQNKIASSDTTVLPQILALPLSSYIGKPVDSLLAVLPLPYTKRGYIIARHGYIKGIYQRYTTSEINDCHIEIYIDHFQYQTFPNYNRSTWNMPLLGKETIAFIKIMKNNSSVCLYGCNDPRYSLY